jgi:hypothetical protein
MVGLLMSESGHFSDFLLVLLHDSIIIIGARGRVVVKALCYKPAGRGFNSQWCHWNFSVI